MSHSESASFTPCDEYDILRVDSLDHFVLTVADVDATCEFYERILGMRSFSFGAGRKALAFGNAKINLHQRGAEISPHARYPQSGSADLCFTTRCSVAHILRHLSEQQIAVEDGPVKREGAAGPMTSVYIRDPDGNLIEIAVYTEA